MQWNRFVKTAPGKGRYSTKILLSVRLTFILTICACLEVSAGTYGQQVTLSVRNAPLRQVFNAIEKQTGYLVFFNNELVRNARPVTLNVKDIGLEEFLRRSLKDQDLEYGIVEKTIIIKRASSPPGEQAAPVIAEAVRVPVTGVVKDTAGHPLPGVTISIRGTKKGTATGANGRFSIDASPGDVLLLSFIGYQPREYVVGSALDISIVLRAAVSGLDETVVKGYYTTSKRLNTGAVGTVRAETIEKQPVSNVLTALIGQVPGLDITQQSGIPGSGVTVRIRGTNSLTATANDPLYLIDGVPFLSNSTNTVPNNFRQQPGGGASPFNSLNPADIESIEILKDADATAIYGSRGANGVILITTKKGKAGDSKIDANFSKGFGRVARMMDLLDRRQYLDMRYEALKNDGVDIGSASYAPDLLQWDTTRSTDWQDLLIGNTAQYTNAQLTFSGGSANTSYSLSGGYWKETAVFPGDFADTKASARFSLHHTSADQRWKAQLTGTFLKEKNNLSPNDPTHNAVTLPPLGMDLYLPDGKLNFAGTAFANPLASLNQKYDARTTNLNANSLISYRILKGLEFKVQLGYSNLRYTSLYTNPESATNPVYFLGPANRTAEYGDHTTETWNIEPQLTYDVRLLGQPLKVLLGTTFQRSTQQGTLDYGSGFVDDALLENKGSAQTVSSKTAYSDYKYNALFALVNYNVDGKYLLNLTARRDGSSRFGPGNRFGNFGAVGAAWIFSEEQALKDALPFLSFGKLRLSYGITGSDAISNYGYISLYNSTSSYYPYYGANGIGLQPANLANSDFKWESNRKADIALELGFLKDRILLNTNFYRNRSSNQLIGYPISQVSGFSSVPFNLPAVVQNTGWEIELNTTNIERRDFSWTTSFNITLPNNKLIDYPDLASSSNANTYVVGEPLTIVKLVPTLGIDPNTGIMRYRNRFGDTVTNIALLGVADRTAAVNTGKQLYGGLLNAFRYKGFQLDVFFQFSKANGLIWNVNGVYVPGYYGNLPQYVYDRRWKGPGDTDAALNKLTQSSTSAAYLARPRNTDEAAYDNIFFARLKNVALAYNFPQAWLKKVKIQNLRVYAQGQNLATFTNYLGMDPENQSASIAPIAVTTFGLQVTF